MKHAASPDCNACTHFYITHDQAFPYGCRKLAMKSRRLPARDVLESSGMSCLLFQAKATRRGRPASPR